MSTRTKSASVSLARAIIRTSSRPPLRGFDYRLIGVNRRTIAAVPAK